MCLIRQQTALCKNNIDVILPDHMYIRAAPSKPSTPSKHYPVVRVGRVALFCEASSVPSPPVHVHAPVLAGVLEVIAAAVAAAV